MGIAELFCEVSRPGYLDIDAISTRKRPPVQEIDPGPGLEIRNTRASR